MSLLSIVVFIIILLVTTARTESKRETPYASASLKKYFFNMMKNHSEKVLSISDKIQKKAKVMLDILKRRENKKEMHAIQESKEKLQIDAPDIKKRYAKSAGTIKANKRSYSHNSGHYTTGYAGTGGASNYGAGGGGGGAPSFHHHSIGFDPINIVLSVSLLSFLLQAIQGLLTRTTMLPQVVQARSLADAQYLWEAVEKYNLKQLNQKHSKKKY